MLKHPCCGTLSGVPSLGDSNLQLQRNGPTVTVTPFARRAQLEVEAGDTAAVRAVEARRREALGERPPHDNVHTLLLKYRSVPASCPMQPGLAAACVPASLSQFPGPARRC